MPSALYAISYKPTSSVIALCRLEKQTLVDKAAWDQLLATLVGPKLPISMSTSDPAVELALPASELGCDLVTDLSPLDLEPVLAEPFRYRVVAEPAGGAEPGDGKPKVLQKADTNAVRTVALAAGGDGAQSKVTVTLRAPTVAGAWLVFEGRPPIKSESRAATDPPTDQIVFRLPAGVAIDGERRYAVMFLMEDTATEARLLRSGQTFDNLRARDTSRPANGPVTPQPQPVTPDRRPE